MRRLLAHVRSLFGRAEWYCIPNSHPNSSQNLNPGILSLCVAPTKVALSLSSPLHFQTSPTVHPSTPPLHPPIIKTVDAPKTSASKSQRVSLPLFITNQQGDFRLFPQNRYLPPRKPKAFAPRGSCLLLHPAVGFFDLSFESFATLHPFCWHLDEGSAQLSGSPDPTSSNRPHLGKSREGNSLSFCINQNRRSRATRPLRKSPPST